MAKKKRSRKDAKATASQKTIKFKSKKGKRILIIDADIVLYQATEKCLIEMQTKDDEWTYHLDLNVVKQEVNERLEELKLDLQADEMILCIGSKGNWRKRVMPEYKANRKGKRKPLGYSAAVEWAKDTFECRFNDDWEADDVCGFLATDPSFKPKMEKILVSEDKDFKSIPGRLYNPRKPELGIVEISVEDADYMHMMQTICGDTADGYKGCPGVGPVKAEMILADKEEDKELDVWANIVRAFKDKDLNESVALESARVARILRFEDVDKHGAMKLWEPKKKVKKNAKKTSK